MVSLLRRCAWLCTVAVAEGEGFEPPGPLGPTVFKTAAIDHSAKPPDPTDSPARAILEVHRRTAQRASLEGALRLL